MYIMHYQFSMKVSPRAAASPKDQLSRKSLFLRFMTISYRLAAIGAISMATAIALGAFGAHGLRDLISDKYLQVFDTGVKYQVYNSLGLLLLSFSGMERKWPARLILAGMLVFSISLYLLSMNEVWGAGLKKLGAITPLGGLLMISGWAWMGMIWMSRRG